MREIRTSGLRRGVQASVPGPYSTALCGDHCSSSDILRGSRGTQRTKLNEISRPVIVAAMKVYSAPGPVCLVREGIERTPVIFR